MPATCGLIAQNAVNYQLIHLNYCQAGSHSVNFLLLHSTALGL